MRAIINGRNAMPHYLMRWIWKDAAFKSMTDSPQDREVPAREIVEAYGGKMSHYYFMFGEFDGMLIAEFPDNESAAPCSMKITSAGVFERLETQVLMTAQEAQRSMQKVNVGGAAYRAPTG
jgi:uncharacterized protein with GYD domain